MPAELVVYTCDLGKHFWEEHKLVEARRTPDEEEGFIIPITITKENIVWELDSDIIDIKKTITE